VEVIISDTGRGMGLGRYITYEIIHSKGGSMSVKSREGGGTTFTIRMPATGGSSGTEA